MMQYTERLRRHCVISPDANVSELAVIGRAGEWRGRDSIYPAVIHAHATISELARVQAGVERDTTVRRGAFIMAGAHIGHDADIGEEADICPNAVICGGATIGRAAKIYSGAVISPNVTVGDEAIIAANSVVTRDVPGGEVWGGSPARYIRERDPF